MPKLVDVLGPVAKLISHHRELMILSSAARKPSYTSDIAATLILPPSMLSLFALLRLLANDQGPNNAGSAAIGSLMLVLVSAAYWYNACTSMNACANPWRVRRSMRLLLANMAMLAAFVVAIQIGF